MDLTELEFLKALGMVEDIIPDPIEYRLHYDEHGDIVMGSMQTHPKNTSYVVVTQEEYNNYFKYHIVNGRLKLVDSNNGLHNRLKARSKDFITVKNHASLILEPDEIETLRELHETDY